MDVVLLNEIRKISPFNLNTHFLFTMTRGMVILQLKISTFFSYLQHLVIQSEIYPPRQSSCNLISSTKISISSYNMGSTSLNVNNSNEIYGKTPKMLLEEIIIKNKLPAPTWTYKELQKQPAKFLSTCVIMSEGKGEYRG